MARAIEDIVNEVDTADIKGLEKVDVENVYQQMDHLMQARPSPMDLYNRWEKQQWAVADLDFTLDKEHWNNLKAFPGIGDQLQQTWTLFFIGEQAVTDTLGPILHAAPTEEDRIFLSTQVVDEARHTVFFMRFFDEVLGISGGLEAALNAVRPGPGGRASRRSSRRTSPARWTPSGRTRPTTRRGCRASRSTTSSSRACSPSPDRSSSFGRSGSSASCPASTRASRPSRGTSRAT